MLQRWGGRLSTLVVFAVLSNILGPEQFGLAALALITVAFLNVISDIGLSTYLLRGQGITDRVRSTCFWSGLLVSGLLASILFAAAPTAARLSGQQDLVLVLRVASAIPVLVALHSVQLTVLKSALEFRRIAIVSLFGTVTGGVVGVVAALLGAGALSLILQSLSTTCVAAFCYAWLTPWRPSLTFDRKDARLLIAFGSSVLLTQLILQLRGKGDDLVVGGMLGLEALGVYTVAKRLVTLTVELFTGVVSQLSLPLFAKVFEDETRLRRTYLNCLRLTALTLTPAMLLLAAVAPVLVPSVFGEQWETSGKICQILALGATVLAVAYFDTSLLYVLGKPRVELGIVSIITATHMIAAAAAAPWGIFAVTLAVTIRNVLFAPVRMAVVKRYAGIDVRVIRGEVLTVWLVGACAAIAAGAALEVGASLLTPVRLTLATSIFLLLYVAGIRYRASVTVSAVAHLVPARVRAARIVRLMLPSICVEGQAGAGRLEGLARKQS